MLIETDFLLSLISLEDKNYARTVNIVESFAGKLKLSPYSLIELDTLLKSKKIAVRDDVAFYRL